MAQPDVIPQKHGVWRILKFLLPLVFLVVGFFGIQVWMVWDEENTTQPEKPIAAESIASQVKSDLAKMKESSGAVSQETPVTLVKQSDGTEQAITSEIPELEYYRLQAGSFKDPKGAEKLKTKLQEMGYGSLIIKSSDQLKVVVMTFFSREQAESIQSEMKSKGVAGYSEKITIPKSMTLLQKDSGRLQNFMDSSLIEIPEMLRELCDYYYLYENQGMDTKDHEALVLKQISRLSDMKSSVENMQVNLDDQVLQTRLKDYLAGYMNYLEKVRKVKKLDRKSLWPGLVDQIEGFGRLGMVNTAN